MNRRVILSFLTCLTVLTALQSFSKLEAQDSCRPVFDAITKVVTTPSHSYSTHIRSGKATSSETVYTQGKVFVGVNGKWTKSPEDPKQVLDHRSCASVDCQGYWPAVEGRNRYGCGRRRVRQEPCLHPL